MKLETTKHSKLNIVMIFIFFFNWAHCHHFGALEVYGQQTYLTNIWSINYCCFFIQEARLNCDWYPVLLWDSPTLYRVSITSS